MPQWSTQTPNAVSLTDHHQPYTTLRHFTNTPVVLSPPSRHHAPRQPRSTPRRPPLMYPAPTPPAQSSTPTRQPRWTPHRPPMYPAPTPPAKSVTPTPPTTTTSPGPAISFPPTPERSLHTPMSTPLTCRGPDNHTPTNVDALNARHTAYPSDSCGAPITSSHSWLHCIRSQCCSHNLRLTPVRPLPSAQSRLSHSSQHQNGSHTIRGRLLRQLRPTLRRPTTLSRTPMPLTKLSMWFPLDTRPLPKTPNADTSYTISGVFPFDNDDQPHTNHCAPSPSPEAPTSSTPLTCRGLTPTAGFPPALMLQAEKLKPWIDPFDRCGGPNANCYGCTHTSAFRTSSDVHPSTSTFYPTPSLHPPRRESGSQPL